MIFEHLVRVHPGYDYRNLDGKNYGIGAVKICLILKGPAGALELRIGTEWYPLQVQDRASHSRLVVSNPDGTLRRMAPAEMIRHSSVRIYDSDREETEQCELIDGNPCFSDCLYHMGCADRLFEIVVTEGDAGLWPALEELYHETFASAAR